MTDDTLLLRRFLRTVRVATHTALAEYEIAASRRSAASPVGFHALAARGAGAFRFPEAGIASADGLVTAHVERSTGGLPVGLVLQAAGAAGLDAYAGRTGLVRFADGAVEVAASFDADGRCVVDLSGLGLAEDDLSAFSIEMAETR